MSRRPAHITQADIARAIRAAKQTGAAEVEVQGDEGSRIIIRINPTTQQNVVAEAGEIIL
jgi:DNA-binding XRE family transcriptional regulator